MSPSPESGSNNEPRISMLTLAALGVVYGDIGTSPLYALRECFFGRYGVAPSRDNVMGVLSLVTWSLLIVISVKYLLLVLRADNDGEGGILALMELVSRSLKKSERGLVVALGMFGAALLYGDGMITPAISVSSAVEGLEVATPFFQPYVVPITISILALLFLLQRLGTGGVGKLFGPVMLVWFATLALVGSLKIADQPEVLRAVNPYHGVAFFARHGTHALSILGIVFLVVTGGEALYADIGHFGTRPIRLGWYVCVLPALLLNYFGQGALVLERGELVSNPFFQLLPAWALYPMVVLATFATVIASQAVISGAFSLTFQAFHLGYLPRVRIEHTSPQKRGQIYVPSVNWMLFVASAGLVLAFRRSGNLAAAYGVAITTTMVITTLLFYRAMRQVLNWRRGTAYFVTGCFLVVDLAFFSANLPKVPDGGWIPLLVAGAIYFLMATWRNGYSAEQRQTRGRVKPVREFLAELGGGYYRRVPGQAVYLSHSSVGTPHALWMNLKHNRGLHSKIVIYTARFLKKPFVEADDHLRVTRLRRDIHRVVAYYGFMESADVPSDLKRASDEHGLDLDLDRVHYFLAGEVLIADGNVEMSRWRSYFYALLARNQLRATRYYGLPRGQVFEIGTHVYM